ncbi:MAG TPA: hypothetical protein VFV50_10520, partial [Bdellovibrionales bacterium]|nr:hypothetical protein [Bdellovibrionales bacterium]
ATKLDKVKLSIAGASSLAMAAWTYKNHRDKNRVSGAIDTLDGQIDELENAYRTALIFALTQKKP